MRVTEQATLESIEIKQHRMLPINMDVGRVYATGLMTFALASDPSLKIRFPVFAQSDVIDLNTPIKRIRYDVERAIDACNQLYLGREGSKSSIHDREDLERFIDAHVRFEEYFDAELRAVNFIGLEFPTNVVDFGRWNT